MLGAAGLDGRVHLFLVTLRAHVEGYDPDLEDSVSYVVLPCVAYGSLLDGAAGNPRGSRAAQFAAEGSVVRCSLTACAMLETA